ncbi:AI-2E family transporter [Microterricola pindariensis]|uniref:AI-2E family transporter n=1 Tax=Microterricola pindariensis TaxID=478010 RepID=A0ABX5ASF1_9MICO|nr:AI-2E family transporter [Microterricola pindariensis]PPL14480.1 AI-2E family transporter [Microterricola pindariensis]
MRIQNAFRLGLVATLGVGLGILILSSIASLSTILTYIGAALFLSLGLDPAIAFLERHRFPRWAAILSVLGAVVAALTGVVFAVIPIISQQVDQLIQFVPELTRRFLSGELVTALQATFPNLQVEEIVAAVTKAVNDFVTNPDQLAGVFGGVLQFAAVLATGLFGVVIVLILTLYFAGSLPSMKRGLYQLVPASKRERFSDLSEQITQSVGRYVVGQVTLAFVNGALSFVFLSIIQAPFPAVLALLAFTFSLVPLVGTITGSVIIVLVCLIPGLGSPLTALVAAIYYIIYMQVEAYVLSPRIMNKAVAVPASVVVIAALAGGSLLGLLGALIAIPTAAAILLIIKQVVIPRQNAL